MFRSCSCCWIAARECCHGNRQRFECRAQGETRVDCDALGLDLPHEGDEVGGLLKVTRRGYPPFGAAGRVTTKRHEGANTQVQVAFHNGAHLGSGGGDAGQMRDGLNRGLPDQLLNNRTGSIAVRAACAVCY